MSRSKFVVIIASSVLLFVYFFVWKKNVVLDKKIQVLIGLD